MKNKKTLILFILIILIYLAILRPDKVLEANGKRVVIDPGHGGSDPGTIGLDGSYEKDINLDLAILLEKELRKKGYDVIMTRTRDEYIHTRDRASMANRSGADIVLSIHCNYIEDSPDIFGSQVLYYKGEENKKLASLILKHMVKNSKGQNKGVVERNDLQILFDTKMPAFIIESGFLSNRGECLALQKKAYQEKLIKGIIDALEVWYGFK